MKLLIVFGAFLVVSGHNTCSKNSGLMKSIQYQLKLVEENNGNCDCGSSLDKNKGGIGFFAQSSKTLQNIPSNTDVIFDLVKTNKGKAYNPTTGTFTAPVEGLYYFSWTVLTQTNRHFYTYLALNGQLMAYNHAHAKDLNMSASQSVVVYMKKDDKVVIKTRGAELLMYGGAWTAFSGFLIN